MSADPRDERILAALDTPLTVRELADRLRQEILEQWAESNGFEVEWGGASEPIGARLLAISEATERGVHAGCAHNVRPRLLAMEKRGLVRRIQLGGHRPMLWRLREGP